MVAEKMMNNMLSVRLFIALCFLLFTAEQSKATTIDELIKGEQLTITTNISSNNTQIVGQPLVIVIEVATDKWFAKGTRISDIQSPDLITLPDNIVSTNGIKKINGATWSTQTKEVTIYPTKSGEYRMGNIDVFISVNSQDNEVVEGWIKSAVPSFEITLPEQLHSLEQYIVSPDFDINLSTSPDKIPSKALTFAIGEAITQTVTFTVSDTPAMMIPPMVVPSVNGVSIYQKPAQVFDKSNRGTLVGTRIEEYTYIFEQAGQFTVPEQTFYWWDLTSNSLVELKVDGFSATILGRLANSNTQNRLNHWHIDLINILIWLLVITTIMGSLYWLFKQRKNLRQLYNKITHKQQRLIAKRYLNAIKHNNYLDASQLLFEYYQLPKDNITNLQQLFSHHPKQLDHVTHLLHLAFAPLSKTGSSEHSIKTIDTLSISQAKSLLIIQQIEVTQDSLPQKITLN